MTAASDTEQLAVAGKTVTITHPGKPYFSKQVRLTKLDIVRYYLSVAEGALIGIRNRPIVLKRFVNGAEQPPFYQKRAPEKRPEWLESTTLSFPSGRTAEELVVNDTAALAWIVNLGCLELHPHAVRRADLDHPDELRVDLDPGPGVAWEDVRRVALEVQQVLAESGLTGYPKTSGSRGIHVNVRIEARWSFTEVRRAALALAREVERRMPELASSKWWKEERHGVFLDYNQNAKDRTTASAYSVRPLADARVSAPLRWSEVPDCEPADFTVFTVPGRFAELGDPHSSIDDRPGSLEPLLELAARDESAGLGDAPWPPHFRKMAGEGTRVAPSRAKAKPAPAANVSAPVIDASGEPPAVATASVTDATSAPAATATGVHKSAKGGKEAGGAAPPEASPAQAPRARATRTRAPLIVIANSADRDAAMAGLERWKLAHEAVAARLAVSDVLVDSMRGTSTNWTRIRVNLRNVPPSLRPAQGTPDPDDVPPRMRQGRGRSKTA